MPFLKWTVVESFGFGISGMPKGCATLFGGFYAILDRYEELPEAVRVKCVPVKYAAEAVARDRGDVILRSAVLRNAIHVKAGVLDPPSIDTPQAFLAGEVSHFIRPNEDTVITMNRESSLSS